MHLQGVAREDVGLERFLDEFKKRDCVDLDILVDMDVEHVYEMLRQITAMMNSDDIALFMVNFTNVVYMDKRGYSDETYHQT